MRWMYHALTCASPYFPSRRAPVLTLWVAVCAERQGFTFAEGLTFGKTISVWFAQSKGRAIGVLEEPSPEEQQQRASWRARVAASSEPVRVCGRTVRCKREADGALRAILGDTPVAPDSVMAYLRRAFGGSLDRVTAAMRHLAAAVEPERLHDKAYDLYVAFRPDVASGAPGWGQKGQLDLQRMQALAEELRQHAG